MFSKLQLKTIKTIKMMFSKIKVNQTLFCYGWYLDAGLSTGGIDVIGI